MAVIDGYARNVLAWRLSNTLDSGFCVDCLEQALRAYGVPEIFNTDQGCQFTSDAFTGALKTHGIVISMDGRGRALERAACPWGTTSLWNGSGAALNTKTCT